MNEQNKDKNFNLKIFTEAKEKGMITVKMKKSSIEDLKDFYEKTKDMMKLLDTLYAGTLKLSVVELSEELCCECSNKTFTSGYAIQVSYPDGKEVFRIKSIDNSAEPYSSREEASEALYYVRYELMKEREIEC